MSNNLFYKALAAVSTAGIVAIAGIQVTTALKKGNNADDQLAKTMVEIKKARKDALAEVKSVRAEILKELNSLKTNTLGELKSDRAIALKEVKTAQKEALASLRKIEGTNKEKIWLVLRVGGYNSGGWSHMPVALEKIAMPTMEECQLQGALFSASKNIANRDYLTGFECLEVE